MLRVLMIRPGSTEFDEQGRIKGSLDIPLNEQGIQQARFCANDISNLDVEMIYSAPSLFSQQTARIIGDSIHSRIKVVPRFQNLDRGLWHGKLIAELRKNQPKVFRQWQESPETVCPPGGETIADAQQRIKKSLGKIMKRHHGETIAIVAPEPMNSIIRNIVAGSKLANLWRAESCCGSWDLVEVGEEQPV